MSSEHSSQNEPSNVCQEVQKTAPEEKFARERKGEARLETAPMTSTGSFLGISFKGKNGREIISKLTHPKGAPRLRKDQSSRDKIHETKIRNDPNLNPTENDKSIESKSSSTVQNTIDTSKCVTPEEGGERDSKS